jgi:predicted RecB family nuclease
MRLSGIAVELSASDLSQSLSCRHLTALNLAVALGRRSPPSWRDPVLVVLRQRGLDHERGYVDGLRAQKLTIIDLSDNEADDAVANSIEAMRSGVDVVVQAALRNNRWFGRPDVLRRVERQSALGIWSYEVIDTKLAKDTRGGTILQLALYSELLALVQGIAPELFHVVTPDPAHPVHTFFLSVSLSSAGVLKFCASIFGS